MVRVKICGITNLRDAYEAVFLGAWALGFIFYKKSPRYILPSRAKKIIEQLPPYVTPVGVFVDAQEKVVKLTAEFCRLQTLQFHGGESSMYCRKFKEYKVIKAFRLHPDFDFRLLSKYNTDAFLFDTFDKEVYGGSGKSFRWELLKGQKIKKPIILSGGLTPRNVSKAIRTLRPYAVDVSSGVEKSPGRKDNQLLRDFFKKIG